MINRNLYFSLYTVKGAAFFLERLSLKARFLSCVRVTIAGPNPSVISIELVAVLILARSQSLLLRWDGLYVSSFIPESLFVGPTCRVMDPGARAGIMISVWATSHSKGDSEPLRYLRLHRRVRISRANCVSHEWSRSKSRRTCKSPNG